MKASALCCLLFIPVSAALFSQEDTTVSFVIAPPPVGYPVFEKGTVRDQTAATAVWYASETAAGRVNFYGAAAALSHQMHPTDFLALGGMVGSAVLFGDKNSTVAVQGNLGVNAVLAPLRTKYVSLFFFGAASLAPGLTAMELEYPQLINFTLVNDRVSATSLSAMWTTSGGAQANIVLADFILSPFALWSWSAGWSRTEMTSAMSFEYPTSEAAIDGVSSWIFGFDLLYVPWDLALSSQFKRQGESSLLTVAFKWLLKRTRERLPPAN